jgi:hypothetical protein
MTAGTAAYTSPEQAGSQARMREATLNDMQPTGNLWLLRLRAGILTAARMA